MFRLFTQELRFRRNGIIGWGIALCFFPIIYTGIYPQVAEEMQSLADLAIYQAMGISLGTFEDWVGSTVILFVPILASIYAIINGTGTLAGEEEDGRLELLVSLPLPRWQIVLVKALALSLALFIIVFIVSLVTGGVLLAIESQIETEVTVMDMVTGLLWAWPLVFAMAMISMFFAAFASSRRIAALLAAVVLIISYFGSNLAGQVSALEPLEFLFLHTYLDYTGNGVVEGQQTADTLVLIGVGLVAFLLAVLFFQRRNLTVGAWPWTRGKLPA